MLLDMVIQCFFANSDYCGDPSPPGTDNNCANAKIEGDFTRNVGTARIFKCNTLLTNFVSAADYCPVQTCQNNYYYSDVSISCGSKF